MPLEDLELSIGGATAPGDVRSFLREAGRRIERFMQGRRIPGFVPSNFARTYHVLRSLAAADLAPGNLFCEWGSGFGVVACLAAMLDFDAFGIEIEGELVNAARQLAAAFGLPVEFVRGSFIPGGENSIDPSDRFAWLTTRGGSTEEELGLGPADFAVIFAYPWPDEEQLIGALFERHAGAGALLLTYHGGQDLRLRRKVGGSPGGG
jgi:hypothetical protein